MATSPADLAANLGDEQRRFYAMELAKRMTPMLPLFEEVALSTVAPSQTFVASLQAAEARRQPEVQQQYAQVQQQAAWINAYSQGAVRPSSNPTPRELEVMVATARQQGYDTSIQKMQEMLRRQAGQKLDEAMQQMLQGSRVAYDEAQGRTQTLMPDVLARAMTALQYMQAPTAEDDDPVWTDI